MQIPLDTALEFVKRNSRAVLASRRKDGGQQMSPVRASYDDAGNIIVWSRSDTAKTHNLARNPQVSVLAIANQWSGSIWVQVDGSAEVVRLPEAMPLLDDYYRKREGKDHENWDEWHRAMEEEQRVIFRIRPLHAASPGRGLPG